jgi:hypothetical protein
MACKKLIRSRSAAAAWDLDKGSGQSHQGQRRLEEQARAVGTHFESALWSEDSLAPGSLVFSDGLSCFPAVAAAGCDHVPVVIGRRKPQEVPLFQWLNTIIGNMKTALNGTHHAFNFKSMEIAISLRCLIASTAGFISRVYYNACS